MIDPFDEATWSEDERFYFTSVDQMLREGFSDDFSNGKPWHAVYIIAAFLREATQCVRLFSGKLIQYTPDGVAIYAEPHVVDAAKTLLTRDGSELKIVLEDSIDVDDGRAVRKHPLIEGVRRLEKDGRLNGRLDVRRATKTDLEFLREHNFLHHMMVMDQRSWRLETDPDPDDVRARVKIGDKWGARTFARVFDEVLFENAEPVFQTP